MHQRMHYFATTLHVPDTNDKNRTDRKITAIHTGDWSTYRTSQKLSIRSLQWRHNDQDGVSNQQPHGCLLNRLYRRRSKKTSKLRVTGLCVGNSPGPVNSPHKGPVTRKMFPFDDVIILLPFLWFSTISQISQCIAPISHMQCNRNMHTCTHFCYKMVNCGIWEWCIVGFV